VPPKNNFRIFDRGALIQSRVAPARRDIWPKAICTVAWGNAPGRHGQLSRLWPKAIFTWAEGCRGAGEYGLRPKQQLACLRSWGVAPGYGDDGLRPREGCLRVTRRLRRRALGGTLIEVAVSTLLVGVLLVAALSTVGARLRHQSDLTVRQRASLLADQMLSEVLELDYKDPNQTPTFGLEANESGSNRSAYDDVDDYHGLNESPPKLRSGTTLTGVTGWTRSTSIHYVGPSDLTSVVGSDQGYKRITVQVNKDGEQLAEMTAVRTAAWNFDP
jgi:MSHA pilin protein MshD